MSQSRVPVITVWFWLIKVMITGADVPWPDYLFARLGLVAASGLIGLAVLSTLTIQFRAARYQAWSFWLAVAAVSVAGTEATNGPHTQLGLSYGVVAAGSALVLAGLLAWWRASEKTLSLRSVDTWRREIFFWAAVLAASALGTAVMHDQRWGDRQALLIWATVAGGIGLAWWLFRLNTAVAFWSCFVVTRPLGTAAAGWLGQGLGTGIWPVSAGLAVAAIGLVTYLTRLGSPI
jgi:uncharacterized membrane-anchored protein